MHTYGTRHRRGNCGTWDGGAVCRAKAEIRTEVPTAGDAARNTAGEVEGLGHRGIPSVPCSREHMVYPMDTLCSRVEELARNAEGAKPYDMG